MESRSRLAQTLRRQPHPEVSLACLVRPPCLFPIIGWYRFFTPAGSWYFCLATSLFLAFLPLASLKDTDTSIDVTWDKPARGDTYGPGDTLVGQWSADKSVVSPSFRLCTVDEYVDDETDDDDDDVRNDLETDDDDTCGQAIWPTVRQVEDGSWKIHMTLPNTNTTPSQCFIEMVDDFGDKAMSPVFSFGHPASEPASSSSSPKKPGASNSHDEDSADSPRTSPSPTSSPHTSSSPLPPPLPPDPSESKAPAPVAAYAVPLSLVGAVIIAAAGTYLYRRRQSAREQAQAQQAARIPPSRQSSLSFAGFLALGRGPTASSSSSPRSDSPPGRRPPGSSRSSATRVDAAHANVSRHAKRGFGLSAGESDYRRADRHADADGAGPRRSYRELRDDDSTTCRPGVSFASPPPHHPRRPTREPFFGDEDEDGRRRRGPYDRPPPRAAPVDRRPPTPSEGLEPSRSVSVARDRERGRAGPLQASASVTDAVMGSYFDGLSPVPLSPASAPARRAAWDVARPEQLYVRRGAAAEPPKEAGLYEAVARRLSSYRQQPRR
ncbi:uncharacterized protein BXZ73DRAFT_90722 [Epithele typhae]|uniref:uncharacterized protein n=1 Tax=Epithele typhae TaxID=378194 RepID=UPI002007DB66|nr:uncharacterized protein BXZ73DRAFT_90722 [Epithele typhae]KAH9927446.1 hypothetical protein BXZ73DRAFT_90722 [Epithele typhae]